MRPKRGVGATWRRRNQQERSPVFCGFGSRDSLAWRHFTEGKEGENGEEGEGFIYARGGAKRRRNAGELRGVIPHYLRVKSPGGG
jgi:hypothetical protein